CFGAAGRARGRAGPLRALSAARPARERRVLHGGAPRGGRARSRAVLADLRGGARGRLVGARPRAARDRQAHPPEVPLRRPARRVTAAQEVCYSRRVGTSPKKSKKPAGADKRVLSILAVVLLTTC